MYRIIIIFLCIRLMVEVAQGSTPSPGGPLSCRVQLQPQLNPPEVTNHGLSMHTSKQVCWGKLELNSAGQWPSRTEILLT